MTTSLTLPHLPPHTLHLTLLRSLPATTTTLIHTALLTHDHLYDYAFLDARTILSTTHLLSACFQALRNALVHRKTKTRTVHSEIVYCLSGNRNILEAFSKFGVSGDARDLVVVKVSVPGGEAEVGVGEVEGFLKGLGTVAEVTDEALRGLVEVEVVGGNYKIKSGEGKGMGVESAGMDALEVEVLGKMVGRVVG